MDRRRLLLGASGVIGVGAIAGLLPGRSGSAEAKAFPVQLSDAAWKQRLSPAAYRVLREAGTERAGSSPLNAEHRAGTFNCAGCANPVYRSADKFESGTGWPSFVRPIPGRVATKPDRSFLVIERTEVHCARCGGHLGHVFDDGPPPTGKRYCMNGIAMRFVPARG